MAKKQIKNYVFKPGIGYNGNLFPNAYALLEQNKQFIQKEATAWIADQVSAGETGFVGYTYNQEKCERDVGFIIDAYLYDMRYGGNSKTSKYASYYWDQDVAQVDGDRQPEIQTHTFIRSLIRTYIFTNTLYTASNVSVTQTTLSNAAETNADSVINTLATIVIDVITNGLSSLPTLEKTGVGTIRIAGKYDTSEILLATNTSKNEIIYNFSSNSQGGITEFVTAGADDDFPSYLQKTDGVTQLSLNYDTSNHSEDDEIQIFVEEAEVRTRPFDFGTDAIERMRVAPALSMLDADFEYGLQPTKWAAIGVLRGYPSVYEIPGTDTSVVSVTTDASTGTNGIGQSLITVTTAGPHGFSIGTPITIKALEDSVVGANRAEGSFVITNVVDNFNFQFYAKAKVGVNNGDVLSTTYTQLREAGFYTGASISTNPEFSIASNGSNGVLVLELDVEAGETILPFDLSSGTPPELGAPLVGTGLSTGTQITAINSTSGGGGEYITPETSSDVNFNDLSIDVVDATGVVPNLALDRGDGTAIYVQSVVGNTINLSGPLTAGLTGNRASYTSVEGSNVEPQGSGAEFTISRANGTYTIDAITQAGINYAVGNKIKISGNDLGGIDPDNNLIIRVISIGANGEVTGTTVDSGVAADGTGTFTGVNATLVGGAGSGARFDVVYENNVFTGVTLNTTSSISENYSVNDTLQIDGASIGGQTITNDIVITVTQINSIGEIELFTFSGTAPDAEVSYSDPNFTTSGIGSGIFFTVTRAGTAYSWQFEEINGSTGVNFAQGDTITVLGSDLGGVDITNDLTLTVDTVDPSGTILTFTVTGTAVNTDSRPDVEATNRVGTGAAFDVSYASDIYTVTLSNGGTLYGVNQELTISGTTIGGSISNDITITITAVDSNGTITTFNAVGTPPTGTETHTGITGLNVQALGSLGSFDINRQSGTYSSIVVSTPGTQYQIGDSILISGGQLGGSSPQHDITIVVTGVNGSGGITTFTNSFDSASLGDPLRLISTVLISEPTTQNITTGNLITFSELATLQISFPSAHGLVPGDTFIVSVDSDDGVNGHKLAAGSFFVSEVPTIASLRYQARTAGTIDISGGDISGAIYPRPDSFFIHRPYDGGVQLGTGGPQHGAQAIRQSKKYIRYQSGKGIMYTTGALFAPSYDLRSVTADGVEVGSEITVVTDDNDHGLQVGGTIRLIGVETPGYNSGPETAVPPQFDYTVTDVVDERTFKIRAQRRLGSTDAVLGFGAQMSVVSWHGATVRSGIFDDQNGIFWEFDGTQISVVQRTGTKQIAGTISIKKDSNVITGLSTRFRDQLKAGDRIIIKGMTHVVSHVNSQTECTVTPDWRGIRDITGTKANLITDKKVKQRDFNLDSLDGTGPSGYNIDVAKMQMIGIQYSWYGAGFIDFMLRGADGNFVFCHRMRNSNVNTEAFMRSGNLPVRYEVTNEGPSGKLATAMDNSQTTLQLVDTSFFPNQGTIYIDNEIITYNEKNDSTNELLNLTRAATFVNFQAGADRSYTAGVAAAHDARTGVILISQTITPLISHWGSAFITDGGFDEDRGYIFSYNASNINVTSVKETAFLIRLAPSVSNAIVGDLGDRELLNRAQLLLQSLEVTSNGFDGSNNPIGGGIVVEGVLNPKNYPLNPGDVTWSGLSSQAQGGQPSFAQVASAAGIEWTTGSSTTTSVTVSGDLDSGFIYGRSGLNNNESFNPFSFNVDDFDNNGYPNTDFPGYTRIFTQNPSSMNPWFVFDAYDDGDRVQVDATSRTGQTSLSGGDRLQPNTTARFVFPSPTGITDAVLVTEATYNASNINVGSRVDASDTNWPPNTVISSIDKIEHSGQTAFLLFFNNPSLNPIAISDTITFFAGEASFAEPGETVFSFIATPGERATVDFSALKELTNTPLGGRGTYPNGPDVLAINIYKSSGADTTANVIINWGEAQA